MVEKLATEFCSQTNVQLKQQLSERKPELDVKVHHHGRVAPLSLPSPRAISSLRPPFSFIAPPVCGAEDDTIRAMARQQIQASVGRGASITIFALLPNPLPFSDKIAPCISPRITRSTH
jgi:hypothetical protein